MGTSFNDLPNELLISIVNHINDPKELCSLARVSRILRTFAEENIYKDILLRSTGPAKKLYHSLQQRQDRAKLIHSINLRPSWHQQWYTLGNRIGRLLADCHNLQELSVESPTCNYGLWDTGVTNWVQDEQALLNGLRLLAPPRLTKLTLHLDGNKQRYWDPAYVGESKNSWAQVWTLPSLVELTISCAVLHDGVEFAPARSTSLKALSLIECNITIAALHKMLGAPKSLEKLHLGENAYHAGQGYDLQRNQTFNNLFGFDPSAFIKALAQQSASLRKLEYIAGDPKFPSRTVKETFEDFYQLREVRLSEHVRDSCCELIITGAPVLQHLTLELPAIKVFSPIIKLQEEHDPDSGHLAEETVKKELAGKVPSALFKEPPKSSLTSIKSLHIVMPHGPVPISPNRRTWVQMLADYWSQHGIQFYLSCIQRGSIFPPILWDESNHAPREVLLYSTSRGFTPDASAEDLFGFDGDTMDLHEGFLDGDDVLESFDFDSFLHDTDTGAYGHFGDFDFGSQDLIDLHGHHFSLDP